MFSRDIRTVFVTSSFVVYGPLLLPFLWACVHVGVCPFSSRSTSSVYTPSEGGGEERQARRRSAWPPHPLPFSRSSLLRLRFLSVLFILFRYASSVTPPCSHSLSPTFFFRSLPSSPFIYLNFFSSNFLFLHVHLSTSRAARGDAHRNACSVCLCLRLGVFVRGREATCVPFHFFFL